MRRPSAQRAPRGWRPLCGSRSAGAQGRLSARGRGRDLPPVSGVVTGAVLPCLGPEHVWSLQSAPQTPVSGSRFPPPPSQSAVRAVARARPA